MNRHAFTLMELLVVVGIILVLMGLLVPAVGIARKAAQRAKTVSIIGQVAAAIDQYRSLNAVYPERWVKPADPNDAGRKAIEAALAPYSTPLAAFASMDNKDCYGWVYSPAPDVRPVTVNGAASLNSDAWLGLNAVLTNQLGALVSDTAKSGLLVDAWGIPLRYRPSKWYPYAHAVGTKPRIDDQEPPGQDSYQLWSAGADKVDDADPGEGGDDVPQWAKK